MLPQTDAIVEHPSDAYVVLLTPLALAEEPKFVQRRDEILRRVDNKVASPRFTLPAGSEFLPNLIAGAHIVDKTALLPALLRDKWTFFLRPRRFGKSFWVSTLECFFSGAAEAFQGFAVWHERIREDTVLAQGGGFVWNPTKPDEHRFPPIPVVRLDFSEYTRFRNHADVWNALAADQRIMEQEEHLQPSRTFAAFIKRLAMHPWNEWQQVVVLIDEYDAPLNANLDPERRSIFEDMRENFVKPFFTELKALDEYICFCFVTGISAFGKTSIWSGANQFKDRSLHDDLAAVCGFTHDEARNIIQRAGIAESSRFEELWQELVNRYDGYRFSLSENAARVFNPFLIRRVVEEGRLVNGWAQTASESVFKYVKAKDLPCLPCNLPLDVFDSPDGSPDLDDATKVAKMLFRAGYATIGAVSDDGVQLNHVNVETTVALLNDYLRIEFRPEEQQELLAQLRTLLSQKDFAGFLRALNERVFSSIAEKASIREATTERYYQTLVFVHVLHCAGAGIRCELEYPSTSGYADMTITYPDIGVVIEFKAVPASDSKPVWNSKSASEARAARLRALYQAAAEEAHRQIVERQYLFSRLMQGYAEDKKVRVAVVADCRMRQLAYVDVRAPAASGVASQTEVVILGWDDMFNGAEHGGGDEGDADGEASMALGDEAETKKEHVVLKDSQDP